MSVSQSYVQESAPEYKYEGDEKDEERNRPVYHELGPKDNSNFHDSIKEKDWESFEKLLKKYKGQYYKRKRIQAKEIEKDKLRRETSEHKEFLGMRDAQSRLFPFQIAALPIRFRNTQLLMRCQFNPTEWRDMTVTEKKREHEMVVDEQDRRQLGTIFESLREYPDAIENRIVTKDPSNISRTLRSRSDLSMHYLSWIYEQNSNGEFGVRYDNLAALRDSILKG